MKTDVFQSIYERFYPFVKGDISLCSDVRFPVAPDCHKAEFSLLSVHGGTIAIIHVVPNLTIDTLQLYKQQLLKIAKYKKAAFAILCSQEMASLIDINGFNPQLQISGVTSLDEALNVLSSCIEKPITAEMAEQILSHIQQSFRDVRIDNKLKGAFFQQLSFDCIQQHTTLYTSRYIHFTSDFENEIFLSLLGACHTNQVCRYTTLDALYRILHTSEQSMCSIACMNDKSEGHYADTVFYDTSKPKAISDNDFMVRQLNYNFISSCTSINLRDNLTMWRMYADNARGVCLVYQVDTELLNQGFTLAPVCYAREDGSHPELQFVRELCSTTIEGYPLRLHTYDLWKHFFKPFEYAVEQEVRLLYRQYDATKYEWIKTSDGIFAPIIKFPVAETDNQYPLLLQEVILGPKSPESDTNLFQLQLWSQTAKLKYSANKLIVSKSTIDNYR